MNTKISFLALTGTILLTLGSELEAAATASFLDEASARCQALRRADWSSTLDIRIEVSEAKPEVEKSAASYCQVDGLVVPNVGFVMRLPLSQWNGKMLELGCGGMCGSTDYIERCDGAVRRGYACIVTDGGHKSKGAEAQWAYNDLQVKIDYAFRAAHVTALAGKALVSHFYGRSAHKAYFIGCSGGGSQALWMAQRFPWDFDGIIAGAPDLSWKGCLMGMLWQNRALRDSSGAAVLKPADLAMLHQAVIAQCDENDGIKDGLIGDPRACQIDPRRLLCGGRTAGCLTANQIEAVRKVYGGPVTSQGRQIVAPGALPGSELTWNDVATDGVYDFLASNFRYFSFDPDAGPSWRLEDFDFDRDYQRLDALSLLEPTNPDLREFQAAGGKLLLYSGWNDAWEGVLRTVDYYESVERLIGGRVATQEFLRLFLIPGMSHCTGGPGAYSVDFLTYLEAWVERGQAPDRLVGVHPKSPAQHDFGLSIPFNRTPAAFSRPFYPYPINARYLGQGDPNDQASFAPSTSAAFK